MAEVKAVFYLPLRDNDGRDLSNEIAWVQGELFIRFAGWTFHGFVKGAYQMKDGTRTLDESAAYFVVCDESRLGELEQLLRDFKGQTTQEAIYLEIHRDVEVRFL